MMMMMTRMMAVWEHIRIFSVRVGTKSIMILNFHDCTEIVIQVSTVTSVTG